MAEKRNPSEKLLKEIQALSNELYAAGTALSSVFGNENASVEALQAGFFRHDMLN